MRLLLLLLTTICYAYSFANTKIASELINRKMNDYVTQRTVVLDRPLMTFHYQTGKSDPVDAVDAYHQMVKISRGFFNDANSDSNSVGPGLYVSVDPVASREYGQRQPQLFVIMLKAGTRILDLRQNALIPEDLILMGHISLALGCLSADLLNFRNSESVACRKLSQRILKKFGVQAILYSYAGSELISNCRVERQDALNVIDESAFIIEGISYFSDTKKIENQKDIGGFVKWLYHESDQDLAIKKVQSQNINKLGLIEQVEYSENVDADTYTEMKAESIWKCGPQRKFEGTAHNGYKISRERSFLGDLQRYIAMADSRFTSKLATNKFDYHLLRGVLKAQYKASGMAADGLKFEDWIRAYKKLTQNTDSGSAVELNDLKSVASLLSEPTSGITAAKLSALKEHLNSDVKLPQKNIFDLYTGVIPSVYLQAGYGPRATAILTSVLLLPLVIGPLPSDPNKVYTAFMAQNRVALKTILDQCAELYTFANQNPETIQAGDCGIVDLSKVED